MVIFSKRFPLYALLSIVLAGILIIVGINYGLFTNLSSKSIKSLGKYFGKTSAILAGIAFAYYIMRAVYLQLKKRNILLPQLVDDSFNSLLNWMRFSHPFIGALSLYFALLHSYIFLFIWATTKGEWVIWSGELALGCLVLMGVLGWSIRLSGQTLFFRKSHRYISFFCIALYLFHNMVA